MCRILCKGQRLGLQPRVNVLCDCPTSYPVESFKRIHSQALWIPRNNQVARTCVFISEETKHLHVMSSRPRRQEDPNWWLPQLLYGKCFKVLATLATLPALLKGRRAPSETHLSHRDNSVRTKIPGDERTLLSDLAQGRVGHRPPLRHLCYRPVVMVRCYTVLRQLQ